MQRPCQEYKEKSVAESSEAFTHTPPHTYTHALSLV